METKIKNNNINFFKRVYIFFFLHQGLATPKSQVPALLRIFFKKCVVSEIEVNYKKLPYFLFDFTKKKKKRYFSEKS